MGLKVHERYICSSFMQPLSTRILISNERICGRRQRRLLEVEAESLFEDFYNLILDKTQLLMIFKVRFFLELFHQNAYDSWQIDSKNYISSPVFLHERG